MSRRGSANSRHKGSSACTRSMVINTFQFQTLTVIKRLTSQLPRGIPLLLSFHVEHRKIQELSRILWRTPVVLPKIQGRSRKLSAEVEVEVEVEMELYLTPYPLWGLKTSKLQSKIRPLSRARLTDYQPSLSR